MRKARLRAVSPERLEYQIPAGVAPGLVQVRVLSGDETVATGVFTAAPSPLAD